ncbi:MAG: hypothetical protein H6711_12835 [Myxococcales bacterium]|nr:hypothetical protein [Myxococcales bacterium]
MPNETTIYTLYPEAEIDSRVRYFDGQFLGSQDFVDLQRYLVDRIRRGLDLMTCEGVARGLVVTTTAAWTLRIGAGTAIDRDGRLLVLTEAMAGVAIPHDYQGAAVDVALVYGEVDDREQGGTSEEAGTRGATRVRETPKVHFYPAGQEPGVAGAVPLARVHVGGDGTCTFDDPDPIRVRAGVRFPTEEGSASPTIRTGGPARPRTLLVDGAVSMNDRLGVGTADPEASVDVRGLAKVDELHVREKSFRVEGEEAKFYPVVFEDLGWGSGALDLEISRPNANADAANAGSMLAAFRVHAPDGSNGSTFVSLEIHQSKRFVAHYTVPKAGRYFVVWLRGARTYAWRANQQARLVDPEAKAKKYGGENQAVLDSANAAIDFDRVKLHAPLDRHQVQGGLDVAGDVVYGGKLSKLDSAEQATATVRAYDLYFGHSSRHGNPGRAIVDQATDLVFNFGGDWSRARIDSHLAVAKDLGVSGAATVAKTLGVSGATSLGGDVTIGTDAARKKLDVSGSATVDQGLSVGGAASIAGKVTVGTADSTSALDVSGDAKVGKGLSVGAGASVGAGLSVAGDATFSQQAAIYGRALVSKEDGHALLYRGKGESAGGVKLFLELKQDDVSPPVVPEVGTSIRFHHSNRYWHRIEGNSVGLHVRDGNASSNAYKALFAGDLTANGNLSVSGTGSVTGRMSVGQLAIGHGEFKVGGDVNKFYPVVFDEVDGWAHGYYKLEICRPHVHTDASNRGSLMAQFEGHTTRWGHGSDFIRLYIRQSRTRFVAGIAHVYESAQIVIWLRGDCTYSWRGWTPLALQDYAATAKSYKFNNTTRSYPIKDSLDGAWNQDTVFIGPEASGQYENDLKIIRGSVDGSGTKICGGGFSVSTDGKCRKISYDIPFANDNVTVVVTQQYPDDNNGGDGGDTRDNAVVVTSKKDFCRIKTGNGSGDHSWRRFHFIAIGQG